MLGQNQKGKQTKQNAGFSIQKPTQDINVLQVVEILLKQSQNPALNTLLKDGSIQDSAPEGQHHTRGLGSVKVREEKNSW